MRIVLLLTAILFSVPLTTNAQEPELGIKPNQPEELLARKLCVGCHLVDKSSGGIAQPDIPSFPLIANPQTVDRSLDWLNAPHAPMPDPHLSRKEVRDLVAYIVAQREQ